MKKTRPAGLPASDGVGWPWDLGAVRPFHDSISQPCPRISIITPSFNNSRYLEAAIRSVLGQAYPNLEYIVIDGGSTDGSVEIIRKYEPWLAFWTSEPDRGQSHALNKGLSHATGEWVAWLNADDLYLPDAFSTVADLAFQERPGWIAGTTIYVDEQLHQVGSFEPALYTAPGRDARYQPAGWLDYVCTKRSGIALPQPSSFWSRGAVVDAGGLNESLRYAMDHELYGRLARYGLRPLLTSAPLAYFRVHHQQKSSRFPLVFWEEELKVVLGWSNQVTGAEREFLLAYAGWLKRYILRYRLYRPVSKLKSFAVRLARKVIHR